MQDIVRSGIQMIKAAWMIMRKWL